MSTNRKVNSLTSGVPSGTLVGRLDGGTGPATYLSIADVGASLGVTGTGSTPAGSGSGASGTGALVLVQTLTAAGSTSLDFTSLGSYNNWKLRGRFLIPATSGATPKLLFGTGAGPTWATTNYDYAGQFIGDSGFASSQSGAAGVAFFQIFPNSQNATPGISFEFDIWTDHSTYVEVAGLVRLLNNDNPSNIRYTVYTGGGWHMSADITGIRFIMSAGNVTSGKLSLYGITE